MKQYKIGDRVWVASYNTRKLTKPCPVCFGKLGVTLILGNGDWVNLPCDYCGHGYHEPTGIVVDYECVPQPESMIITEIKLTKDNVEYRANCRILYPENVFNNKDEAMARSIEIGKNQQHDEETRAEHIKANQYKSYSWNAGYHMRKVVSVKREIEYHAKMARICKDRSKEFTCGCGHSVGSDEVVFTTEHSTVCQDCYEKFRADNDNP